MSRQRVVIPIIDVPQRYAENYPKECCLMVRNQLSGVWDEINWSTFGAMAHDLAKALVEAEVQEGDRIGVFSENSDKFLAADLGIFRAGAIAIPFYASSSPSQVQYMVEHSGMKLLFVGEQAQYVVARAAMKEMVRPLKLVLFDRTIDRDGEDIDSIYLEDFLRLGSEGEHDVELSLRRSRWSLDKTALILYTSGTSGTPKGVELTFRSVQAAIERHAEELRLLKPGKVSMNFLPLTHIFEKMWCYVCLTMGVRIAVNRNPKEILKALTEVHPHYMCNVPRFWEKVYVGVYEKIQSFPLVLRKMTDECIRVSRKYHFEYRAKGKKPPTALKMQYNFYSRTFLNLLRKKVGIERGLIYPVAGAALADKVQAFLLSIGVPIVYGYGLTETTATVCYCRQDGFEFGSIGRALGGVSIRIDEAAGGEILVKGDTVMKGYYLNPEANAAAFTEDGWFRTGDLGSMDAEGNVFFKERAKDLFKTANGKYIVPNQIENMLTSDGMIEQAVVIADGRSFVSALILPNWEKLISRLTELGIANLPEDKSALAKHPEVNKVLQQRIDEQLESLASYEKVKKFYVLTEPLSIDNGMLTNSLKTKRLVVEKYYEDAIRDLYSYHKLPDLTE
ncbi:AMP-dependent synthetase/ligase [Porphyromonas levii]|uniref:AMP-dependent synthetase/ligase n=1 Tax=Porphyromonas levii TaxID=28114 RepID=UPI0003707B53|nr:long-chain fatty acid--CoA ligase [Porphyromonas levii]MBR8702597.1 Long-chain-fatty-acid--CoA ligase FadD15 [Porphyromonas levii]MBR8729970.1 Long-chain-fatty-acid--CoA ligase FadD15 [Porphyromonas levii]MBR8730928.1 Long-chain-fatty-acid--CoA ligase FadD15 [Porphyromonas levii]MBR8759127.1 Long-chain-fatty-acid--CoA ligase FadD15 [Porphyromonas levii]MBR8764830.1 Long-chain-fatty-acid--CoA ligase FadD15 [Porphyromonas levii]